MSTTHLIARNVQITTESCYLCGVIFGMEAEYLQHRLNDKKSFYCPNGHSQAYIGKTEAEKLREELEAEKKRTELANRRASNATERAQNLDRRLSAAKGQQTKLKNRIANGVCPCCQRSFVNLQRHIAGQHPDFPGVSEGGE